MSDNQESSSSPLVSFMYQKSNEKNSSLNSNPVGLNKTQQNLAKAKQKKKDEKDKELFEAKKDSMFKASRYNQSHVTNRRVKETGIVYIIAVVVAFIILLAIIKIIPVLGGGIRSLISGMVKIK